MRDHPIWGEDHQDFLGESEGSPPHFQDSCPDAGEARNDFWSILGVFIYRHHVEPRVKLYTPREDSFSIPLKYIDVTRATHTTLDEMQQSRIDDYWNIEESRDLSDSWTGFTQFTLLKEKAPVGFMWSGGDWRNGQQHPGSKLKEKQNWAGEKPKLENVRKLRGIYFMILRIWSSKRLSRMHGETWTFQ